jgi:hypothetical protein
MDSFINVTVSAYAKLNLDLLPFDEGNEMETYLKTCFDKHKLSTQLKVSRIREGSFLEFNFLITEKYKSTCEYWALQATDEHTLIICINSIDLNYLSNGLERIWEDHSLNMEKIPFGKNKSNWAFTFSIFKNKTLDNDNVDSIFQKLALSIDDFGDKFVTNNSFEGWCNWNGGFILLKKEINLFKLFYCLFIQFAKWEITEITYREAIATMSKLLKGIEKEVLAGEEKLLELYSKQIYFNTVMEKALVSYDQEDISLHELMEKGWEFTKLKTNSSELFVDINKVVSLSNGIELKKTSAKTNVFLTYIGIIGFSGTVAGIISTIDFSNSILSSAVIRFSIIFVSTFMLLFLFNKFKKIG